MLSKAKKLIINSIAMTIKHHYDIDAWADHKNHKLKKTKNQHMSQLQTQRVHTRQNNRKTKAKTEPITTNHTTVTMNQRHERARHKIESWNSKRERRQKWPTALTHGHSCTQAQPSTNKRMITSSQEKKAVDRNQCFILILQSTTQWKRRSM